MSLTLYRSGVWEPKGPVELPDVIDAVAIFKAIVALFPDGQPTGDKEHDHMVKDQIRQYVLLCIAEGRCADPRTTAAATQALDAIKYTRWYA